MPPFKSSLSTSAMHAKHCFWCPKERTSILQFGQCPKENVQFLTKYDRFSHFTWLRVCIKVSRSITSSLQPCQANFVTFAQLSQFCPFSPFLLVRGHTARLVWTFSHFWNTFGLLKIKKVTAFGNLKTRLSQFLWILSIFSVLVSIRFIFQHLNRYGN